MVIFKWRAPDARGLVAAIVVLFGHVEAPMARAAPVAWVEMTAEGAQARLVTLAPHCPPVMLDGRRWSMKQRAPPQEGFAGRVCQAPVPPRTRRASIGGLRLPIPRTRPQRIVVLGDSGCRLKGAEVQRCNDPRAWPFARVAALAAAARPDLVIHVGDYYYRETPCPAAETGCARSPSGDRWASWDADLFTPAAPLLAAAPWVFARGNHESCKRGGGGWFRMLDAALTPLVCPATSESFAVDIDGERLFVVDSADTEDAEAPEALTAAFAAQLHQEAPAPAPLWIVTHRPFWYALREGDTLSDGRVNATERAAAGLADLSGVDLVLSGHVHNFTSLDFAGARPAQLIVGSGGDQMEPNDLPPPVTGTVDVDGKAASVFTMGRFGYLLLERRGSVWTGAFHDLSDAVIARCRQAGRSLRCDAALPAAR